VSFDSQTCRANEQYWRKFRRHLSHEAGAITAGQSHRGHTEGGQLRSTASDGVLDFFAKHRPAERDVASLSQHRIITSSSPELPGAIIWIDLLNPTRRKRNLSNCVQACASQALSEIESSSRLIVERGTIYLSTLVVAYADTPDAS
jgi:hypothetical protein